MKKQRNRYTPEEKVTILRRHLVEWVPISDLSGESGIRPILSYRWQKELRGQFGGSGVVHQIKPSVASARGLFP
jgi:transposase